MAEGVACVDGNGSGAAEGIFKWGGKSMNI